MHELSYIKRRIGILYDYIEGSPGSDFALCYENVYLMLPGIWLQRKNQPGAENIYTQESISLTYIIHGF